MSTYTAATQRDPSKLAQMSPEERALAPTKANVVNHGVFKTRKEAQAKLDTFVADAPNYPWMVALLGEYGMSPFDVYAVAKTERGGWSLGNTAKHEVAIALQQKLPVNAVAVDTYGIKLPEGYAKQGELYVY